MPARPRLSQYKFHVNAQSVIGNLTWNANGTLQTLAITDPLNSANSQTCSYSYDDLVRISSAGCGATWSQTFSFDPFGNISKSGTGTFQPTYNTMNRYQTLPGFTPSYDANGNLLNDSFHQYTWDQNFGNVLSIDTVGLTYDALGRMVEQNRSAGCPRFAPVLWGLTLRLRSGQALGRGTLFQVRHLFSFPDPARSTAIQSNQCLPRGRCET